MRDKIYFEHLKNFTSSEGYWDYVEYIDIAKDIINTTNINSLLEIGFNIGYSANIWLQNGIDTLHVIDINMHPHTIAAAEATIALPEYKDKNIKIWLGDSTSPQAFTLEQIGDVDATFVDGAHNYENVLLNSYLAINYGSKYIIYDDVHKDMRTNNIFLAILKLEKLGLIELIKEYPRPDSGLISLYKVKL